MSVRIVRDGRDPLTNPVFDYVVDRFKIDPKEIVGLLLDSQVGEVQTITIVMQVQEGK